jgi:phage/plasmid-associated DNA primase
MDPMYGSMANIAGKIDGKKFRYTASIKDITGGDQIEIGPKGRESFFDHINTTLLFAANDPLILGERDNAAIASWIVPMNLPYKVVDDPSALNEQKKIDGGEFKDRIETPEALNGLLNLSFDGIDRLEENRGDISLSESPTEGLRNYKRTADPMRKFGGGVSKTAARTTSSKPT